MNKQQQGKRSRAQGASFELKVRRDLEEKGWIVDRWSNNVEFHDENSLEVSGRLGGKFGKIVPAKVKWRRTPTGMFPMGLNSGFPDFIIYKPFEVGGIGIECKMTGKLDKLEKEKCKWMIENGVFDNILIASKEKEGRKIVIKYKEFEY